ncbi:unnamed protein product [Schistosoma margrebowiei]|uniref:Uncharacterized protein n=1 Tax=Schistosoma margrebowiei TaxID=48269 RepID=A0A3P7ZP02_9TREM|nr:unnamed protein product [Schistosoma margrebowiei]
MRTNFDSVPQLGFDKTTLTSLKKSSMSKCVDGSEDPNKRILHDRITSKT